MTSSLPEGWVLTTWGDLATLEYGKALRDYKDRTSGVPVFGTNGPIGHHERRLGDGPTVVIGRKGAYRGVHYSSGPFYVIDTAFWLKPKVTLDVRWAYFELRNHDINGLDSGSAIPSTSRDSFYRLPVLLPPFDEQKRIAELLGALDDKIEANRQRAATSVELARTTLLAALPVEEHRLGDVAMLEKGLSYKGAGLAEAGVPMLTLGSFSTRGWLRDEGWKHYTGDYKPKHLAKPRELLVANTDLTQQRLLLGQPLIVPPGRVVLFSHHVTAVRLKPGYEHLLLPLWAAMTTHGYRARVMGFATGTTVAALPKDGLLGFSFAAPGDSNHAASREADLLLDMAWQSDSEIVALAELRDTLLPKLLSGELRVRELEEAVEDVA